jgi:hypothetical protein
MLQSINTKDLKPEERKFFEKQGIDAWALPTEMFKI